MALADTMGAVPPVGRRGSDLKARIGIERVFSARSDSSLTIAALAVGTVIGLVGYEERESALGLVAVGAGGSMVAYGIVMLLGDLL